MINPEVDKLIKSLERIERTIDLRIEIDPYEEMAYPPGTIETLEEIQELGVWLQDYLADHNTYDPG